MSRLATKEQFLATLNIIKDGIGRAYSIDVVYEKDGDIFRVDYDHENVPVTIDPVTIAYDEMVENRRQILQLFRVVADFHKSQSKGEEQSSSIQTNPLDHFEMYIEDLNQLLHMPQKLLAAFVDMFVSKNKSSLSALGFMCYTGRTSLTEVLKLYLQCDASQKLKFISFCQSFSAERDTLYIAKIENYNQSQLSKMVIAIQQLKFINKQQHERAVACVKNDKRFHLVPLPTATSYSKTAMLMTAPGAKLVDVWQSHLFAGSASHSPNSVTESMPITLSRSAQTSMPKPSKHSPDVEFDGPSQPKKMCISH